MIIDNNSWKKLKEYVDNLYWDEDRMSSDGVHFLNKLDNEIKQIEKNQKILSMLLQVIVFAMMNHLIM